MSEVKVNKISTRTACGTVTLGDSGDTFTIPSGATITNAGTASGFGATGAVSWDTTVKTTGFTAVSGTGYFCNTTGGIFTVTLPLSPSAGDVIGVADYAKTFDTNGLTLGRNGSNINGDASDSTLTTEGLAATLIYVDGTKGWITTDTGLASQTPGPLYVTATGGTPCAGATCGNYKTHTFTGPGALCVSCAGNTAGSDTVEYIVVAGGGGGGAYRPTTPGAGGGGGAGGFRFASPSLAPLTYPGKPLAGPAALPVSATPYAITVGGGGAGQTGAATVSTSGNPSTFSTITSTGGGGTNNSGPTGAGLPGGSGGGAGGTGIAVRCAGSGNTPPVSPPQGNNGGTYVGAGNPYYATAGGGGAIAVGESIPVHNTPTGGAGGVGAGIPVAFGSNGESCGSFRYYAGGGGGSIYATSPGAVAGAGGVGGGGAALVDSSGTATGGTINTGGGAGGQGNVIGGTGGLGGSGIVIIRYKYQ